MGATATIGRNRDGRVSVWLESSRGFPAADLARRKLGAEHVLIRPAEMLAHAELDEAAVVAFVQGTAEGKAAARAIGFPAGRILPSGYRIEVLKSAARAPVLAIVGGDLFGMLAGLADVLLRSELTPRALVYRGGARTERPAFPLRYYWTWDHSTNWVLDDEGNQYSGCQNTYLKKPETYVEDYRRLVDHCVEMRFNGIVIWGFLRDAHGGAAYAYDVARYAADRGVAILPGLGTTGYGGVYYEGEHPCNLETYLRRYPDRGNMGVDGQRSPRETTPHHRGNQEWIRECVEWLYREFPIGGANLENNDLMVDHSPAGKRARAAIRSGEADYFKDQFFAYKTALDVAEAVAPGAWNTYATYSGFGRGDKLGNAAADMGRVPYFATRMPPSAVAQWTLTGMLSGTPVPLRDWLESGRPAAAYRNPKWPKGLRPPTPRSAGFIHQASQWSCPARRTDLAISTFSEACLRGQEAGLEGLSVHGEVSRRSLAWNLNYLAMRHWTYHPQSSLSEFATAELAPRLGGEKDAQVFAESLCLLEEGKTGNELDKKLREISGKWYPRNGPARGDPSIWGMWEELLEWNILKDNRKSSAHGATRVL